MTISKSVYSLLTIGVSLATFTVVGASAAEQTDRPTEPSTVQESSTSTEGAATAKPSSDSATTIEKPTEQATPSKETESKNPSASTKDATGADKKNVTAPDSTKIKKSFGRIDEIGATPSPSSGLKSDTKKYSGRSIDSFPPSLVGNWGGKLQIFSYKQSGLYQASDRTTAGKTALHLQPGRSCATNFNFQKVGSSEQVRLDPVKGVIFVPMASTLSYDHASTAKDRMSPELQAMAQKSTIPLTIYFDTAKTSGSETGVGGNQIAQAILKESIRELGPNTYEKQIFLTNTNVLAGSRKVLKGFDENVIWFQVLPEKGYLYARICALSFSEKGELLSKLVLSGTLSKGRHVNTNAESIIKQMMQNMH